MNFSSRLAALPVLLLSASPAFAADPTFASAYAEGPLGPTALIDPAAPPQPPAETQGQPGEAQEQAQTAAPRNDRGPDTEAPVALAADEVTHDKTLNIVTARGDVEIEQAGYVLYADTVSYNVGQDIVTATGNVSLITPQGDVIFADFMQLTDKMKAGAMRDLLMVASDLSRTKARGAKRSVGKAGQQVNELDHGVYSPCDVCAGKKDPLWQIKAAEVIHDEGTHEVVYHDAWIDMFGYPVAYTPYLSHADPTVKRRSGLLYPSYGNSSTLGTFVRTPYYWVTSENSDVTLTPMLTSDMPSVMIAEYRQNLADGSFILDASGRIGGETPGYSYTDDYGVLHQRPERDGDRGHLRLRSEWDINDTWRSTTDLRAVSSDTYLRRYKLDNRTDYMTGKNAPRLEDGSFLTSRATLEGFAGDDYARIEAVAFRELRALTDPVKNPFALPRASWSHTGEPGVKGGYWTTQLSTAALTRTSGTDSYRISGDAIWTLPYVAPSGEHYTLTTALRTDVYEVDDYLKTDGSTFTGTAGRIVPEASLRWSWPFASAGEYTTQVIEPVVVGSISPRGGNPTTIPNEDSRDLDFDDTQVLSANHFIGRDRIETGPRASYGVNWNTYMTGTSNVFSAFLGQTWRAYRDAVFDETTSGIREGLSDYVGRLRYQYGNNFFANYRFRLNQSDFDVVGNDITVGGGGEALRLSMSYINDRRLVQQYDNLTEDVEQVAFSAMAYLTRDWSFGVSTSHSLTGDAGPRALSSSAIYEDECFRLRFTGSKDYTSDRDAESGWSVLMMLTFKTMGDTQFSL
ncbi:LPS-assembly protein LptD [Oleispirillum naphthae]|uniref:LPS-assembly protein LptD n=1 Tax=Oleispirillum naphthae TaxID=2838853 RepID=UPI0030826676